MPIDAGTWPDLKKAWDRYGHSVSFEQLDGLKSAQHTDHVVVRWTDPDGTIWAADLIRTYPGTWEFENDEIGPITPEQWDRLKP